MTDMPVPIEIDPALVERYLHTLARYGAYAETGVWRTVYSPEWAAARDQYAAWCIEAGLEVRHDAVGNVWGRLEGREDGPSIVSGSHIDSQRPGGRYDGALGALGALIALRALKEQFGAPRRTLEAVAFCEEESSRFPTANFWASRAVTGRIAPGEAEAMRGYDGENMAEVMRAVGLEPARIGEATRDDVGVYVELHIEQGPLLELAGLPVGIVTAITGLRHYLVEITGRADHAGAVPMDLRRDPMAAAAEVISGAIGAAMAMGRPAVTTVGRVLVEPNYPAIVPERVTLVIDARHPDPDGLRELCARHEALLAAVAARRGVQISWRPTLDQPPATADPALVSLFTEAARAQGIPSMAMHSGAGHDAQIMARLARICMIFVQSRDGRSHTPAEYTSLEHAVAGIRVLAAGLHALAYGP